MEKAPKEPGPHFINRKRYELVVIAHLHIRIIRIQRVGQSTCILPIHLKREIYQENQPASIFS